MSQICNLYCTRFLRWTERWCSSSAHKSQSHRVTFLVRTKLWQTSWSCWATTGPSWCGSQPLPKPVWSSRLIDRLKKQFKEAGGGIGDVFMHTGNWSDAAATPGPTPSSTRKQAAVGSARKEWHLFWGTSSAQSFPHWLLCPSSFSHPLAHDPRCPRFVTLPVSVLWHCQPSAGSCTRANCAECQSEWATSKVDCC